MPQAAGQAISLRVSEHLQYFEGRVFAQQADLVALTRHRLASMGDGEAGVQLQQARTIHPGGMPRRISNDGTQTTLTR